MAVGRRPTQLGLEEEEGHRRGRARGRGAGSGKEATERGEKDEGEVALGKAGPERKGTKVEGEGRRCGAGARVREELVRGEEEERKR